MQRVTRFGNRNSACSHISEKTIEHDISGEVIGVIQRLLQFLSIREDLCTPVDEEAHFLGLVSADDLAVGGDRPIV